MTDESSAAIHRFRKSWPKLYQFAFLGLQAAGILVIAHLVGTVPMWRLVLAVIGMMVWSLTLVELNYRLGEDPRYV